MSVKTKILWRAKCLLAMSLFLVAWSVGAALYTNYVNTVIPDGNLAGMQNTINVTGFGAGSQVSALTVTVNVTGGWNGDLYAYLSHGDGFAVLLNRVGRGVTTSGSSAFGYGNTGFNITFAAGGSDVHWYQNAGPIYNGNGQLTGTWGVDGRNISPVSSAAAFDANGTTSLSSFNGTDPNGGWTLFFADVVGGNQSTLQGWSLDLTVIPEPTATALVVFLAMLVGNFTVRRMWLKARPKH